MEKNSKTMKRQYFSLYMWSVVCSFFLFSCEDGYELKPDTSGEKWVNVFLNIDLEQPQDAYDLEPQTRSNKQVAGFSAGLEPAAKTRGVQLTPDKLYNLEIGQYEANGNRITSITTLGTKEVGEYVSADLQERTGCQLLVVVRGSTNILGSIGTGNLAAVRNISTSWSSITGLPAESPSQDDINKMPYILLLENVNATSDGKITSPDGKDVRLLLKRLAARVTVKWDFSISGYELKEVNLQQVPKLYKALPTPYGNIGGVNTYPSLLDEYVDAYRLIKGAKENPLPTGNSGSHTVWVPANVRGIVPKVVNQSYRSKDNAPEGAMFAEFRVEKESDKKRLLCRVYIGANSTSDFNVRENTDYTWSVVLSKGNVADERVTEQSLGEVKSNNLVSTANCIMIEPGADICFNPYRHTSGTAGWNDYLVDDPSTNPQIGKQIVSMKVLWQMKDAGMTGTW